MKKTALLTIILIVSCKTGTSDLKRKNMNEIKREVTSKSFVELPAATIWDKLVSFGGTEKFVPELIEKVNVQGEGIGAIRTIHLKGGGEIVEKLTKIDVKNYHMEFIILSTPMPIQEYTGVFEVQKISSKKCEVLFISKYKVSRENENEMKNIIKGFQETFISNLDK